MSWFDKIVVASLPYVPRSVVGKVASQYIAGERLDDAVRIVRALNRLEILATVDVLGEFVSERPAALEDAEEYIRLLNRLHSEKLAANASVKLTALGLSIDPQFCRENLCRVLDTAQANNTFVRIDMEDSPYTTETLRIYTEMRAKYSVGIVIQAYLRRSLADIDALMAAGTSNFRLCKGIYVEPESIAYKERAEIRQNFLLLLERMLRGGAYVGIATHDDWLVTESERLIKQLDIARDKYEFQMLLGVRPQLRDEIKSRGHVIRTYVPYGQEWYGYSTRRLKENPRIAGYVLKGLFTK
jgi:proline dehydrogenase